jgi:hypothetical protein
MLTCRPVSTLTEWSWLVVCSSRAYSMAGMRQCCHEQASYMIQRLGQTMQRFMFTITGLRCLCDTYVSWKGFMGGGVLLQGLQHGRQNTHLA